MESVIAGTSGGKAVFVAAAGFGTRLTSDSVATGIIGDTGIEGKFVFVAAAGLGMTSPMEFVTTGMNDANAVFVAAAVFETNGLLESTAIGMAGTGGIVAEAADMTFPFESVRTGTVGAVMTFPFESVAVDRDGNLSDAAAAEMGTTSPSDIVNPAGRPPSGAAVDSIAVGTTDDSAPATLLMGTMSPSDVVDPAGSPPSGAAVGCATVGITDGSAPATLLMGTMSPSDVVDPAGRPPSGAAVGCATVGITDDNAPATLLMGTMSPSDVVDPAGRPPSGAAVDSTAVGTTDDSAPATLLMGTISPSDVVDSAGRPPSSVVSAAVGMTTFGNIDELGATLLPNAFVKVVYSAGSVGIGRSESWAGLNTTPAFVVPDGPLLDATALLSPLLSPPLRSVAVAGRPVSDTGRETSVVFTPDKPTPNEAPIDGGVLSLPVSRLRRGSCRGGSRRGGSRRGGSHRGGSRRGGSRRGVPVAWQC